MRKRTHKSRRRPIRYARAKPGLLRALERFHTMGLRLAGFLHQFKTPLHVVQSQAEFLLEDSSLAPQTRQSLEMIRQNTARLSAQTMGMLEAARGAQTGTERVSVEKLVESICSAAEVDCRRYKIVLHKEIEATAPIQMDTVALEGALHNLVNNAIEAMPQGGTLSVRTFDPTDHHRVGLEIRDTGAGMAQADLARLKKPFQTSKSTGTGLGVYITKHILRRHHASVRWQSKPGFGTTVTILFPKVAA